MADASASAPSLTLPAHAVPWWLRGIGLFMLTVLAVLALVSVFFVVIGQPPHKLLWLIVMSGLGDGYALSETLVKTTPILLCAMATALPARLGLITVGAEGQLYFGALLATGFVLGHLQDAGGWLFPTMLLVAALAGAVWSLLPALLRTQLGVSETITTLLVNYIAALLVTWVVYGPWKNPASQGWPATADFPAAFKPATYFDTRVHTGLWIAIALCLVLHGLVTRTRWGLALDILRGNARAGAGAGLQWRRNVLLVMLLGGALAGLAGILETASVQGRLQAHFSVGAGFSGFLVAWLAGNNFLRLLPMSLLVGALLAAGDGMQMMASLPSSVSLVVQGLLFVAVLGVGGWAVRRGGGHG